MREKFKRFFLRFFSRGVTTTHPLCSVFISCFLCFLIVFCSGVCSVYAVDLPLPPVSVPINPYSTEGLSENFEVLNDDQKKIVEEILGLNTMTFFGLGYWPLTRGYDSTTTTRQKLEDIGRTFLNTFFDSVMGTPRAMQDLVGSATYKASTYDDYDDFVADTTSVSNGGNSDHYYLEFPWELTVAYKNWYAVHGGVYDWQFQTNPFSSSVAYRSSTMNATATINYNNYLNESSYEPIVRYNWWNDGANVTNGKARGLFFSTYTNLFYNTSSHTFFFYDDAGNRYSSMTSNLEVYYQGNNGVASKTSSSQVDFISGYFASDYASVDSLVQLVKNLYNFAYVPNGYTKYYFEDFVKHVYVGANWSSKQEIFNIDDLDIGQQSSNYIDNVGETMYVDATGVIDDLSEGITDTNQLVRDNTLVRDGDLALPYADAIVKAIDKYITTPESGVVIVPTLFQNLGKYITYLYDQTKPLVIFTRDLLDCFTFDGTGLAWVFFGAVSVGLIGGVICKFLL